MSGKGFYIAEEAHVVNALSPVDVGGGAKTADYWKMAKNAHATIIVTMGVVGNDTLIKVFESEDDSGTNEAAIAFDRYEEKTAAGDTLGAKTATGVGGFQTGTNNGTTFVIEIDASQLTDGKSWLTVKTDAAAAALISVLVILSGARYAKEQSATAIA